MIFLLTPNNFPFICNVLELQHFIWEPSDPSERLLAYTRKFSGFGANFPVAIYRCVYLYLALGCVIMIQGIRKASIVFQVCLSWAVQGFSPHSVLWLQSIWIKFLIQPCCHRTGGQFYKAVISATEQKSVYDNGDK